MNMKLLLMVISGGLMWAPIVTWAQSDGGQLDEITVTAQKREQSLEDVGISVTAFTGENLHELGLLQPADLAAQTPNLNINNTFQNVIANVSIRGVGLNDYAVNNNPAAGVYVDEVYLVSPAMLSFQLYDLERVEVLRGPQGTLFGRNTTAGAVNFVSNKPGDVVNGYANLKAGDYDLFGFEGAVGGPISDTFGARVAIQTTQQGEGHQFNRATGKKVGEVDRTAGRVLLEWTPTEQTDFLFNYHRGVDKSDTWLLKVDNSFTAEDDAFFPGDPYSSAGNDMTYMDIDSSGASLIANFAISDTSTITSVTGYEDYDRRHLEDRDGSALIQLDAEYLNKIEQISQELRWTYTPGENVVIFGAFFENDDVRTRDRFDTADLPFGFFAVGNEFRQETDSLALFAHTEWQLSDAWRLTAGLRYTDEKKVFSDAFTFMYFDALPRDGGTQSDLFAPVRNTYDVSDVSGKVGLDYTGFENTLWYFSISKGFKSGNFQGQLAFDPSPLTPFDEENLYAYEVGFKSTMSGNTLRLNGALFFYDYKDIQVYGPIFDSVVGPLFGITNVGDAENFGGELELTWLASEYVDISAGIGYLDTEITDSTLASIADGSELPNSPKLNFSTKINYSAPITESIGAEIIFDAAYKDDVIYDIVRAPQETIEGGYWLANLRAGIASADGNWRAYFWSRNLFDERYRSQVLTSTVGFGETWGMPRTYGIGFEYTW